MRVSPNLPMATPTRYIDGVALWAPTLPGWEGARAAFCGDGRSVDPARRPSPQLLPAAERRRAPDSVALALEVASHAVARSGVDPHELLSVFTSAHGDLAINDYLCRTLVEAPTSISPTKFHNSVHNAASGYWTIATGCMRPSIAMSAFECSFAAGLLEALTQSAAEDAPVLLVGYDVAACGALISTNDSRGFLAVALVIVPRRGERTVAEIEWSLTKGPSEPVALRSEAALPLASNAMADALPLFEALALREAGDLTMPLSEKLGLTLRLAFDRAR
jgi:Beta-ketoacyl synthase, N-terminal domain